MKAELGDGVLDLELPVTVRFGHAEVPLRRLMQMSVGSLVEFGKLPEGDVEVLVRNRVLARGVLIVVDGHYAVRIKEISGMGGQGKISVV